MTPGAISMAMVRLTLPISSSSPPTLARQADKCGRCEKTKARVHSELGRYFLGQAQGPVPTAGWVELMLTPWGMCGH